MLAPAPLQAQPSTSCFSHSIPQYRVKVKRVLDGDTLILSDKRHVRIIGINTPELDRDHKNSASHRWAEKATARARELIFPSTGSRKTGEVMLAPGSEARDTYGRYLFHVFIPTPQASKAGVSRPTEGGWTLLGEQLIREGLAVQSAVAPNTRCANHYSTVESQTRKAQSGLWTDDTFWHRRVQKLLKKETGFMLISDRVKKVSKTRSATILELQHGLRVRLPPSAAWTVTEGGANSPSELSLQNRLIEVRGWISRYQRKHWLRLHHRSNLRVIE